MFGKQHGRLLSAKLHRKSDYEFSSCNHYNDVTAPIDNCTWKCGDNANAVLYKSGTLYVIGDGDMYDFDFSEDISTNKNHGCFYRYVIFSIVTSSIIYYIFYNTASMYISGNFT